MPQNVEIKARCAQPDQIHQILKAQNARFVGIDHQIDTYFNVAEGRLKLREGNIENQLIFYQILRMYVLVSLLFSPFPKTALPYYSNFYGAIVFIRNKDMQIHSCEPLHCYKISNDYLRY